MNTPNKTKQQIAVCFFPHFFVLIICTSDAWNNQRCSGSGWLHCDRTSFLTLICRNCNYISLVAWTVENRVDCPNVTAHSSVNFVALLLACSSNCSFCVLFLVFPCRILRRRRLLLGFEANCHGTGFLAAARAPRIVEQQVEVLLLLLIVMLFLFLTTTSTKMMQWLNLAPLIGGPNRSRISTVMSATTTTTATVANTNPKNTLQD